MPPIRSGDGTGLTPKGFAEVRKGDGTVLWSPAADAIPNSAIHRWAYSAGTGTTATDSVGSSDATLSVSGMWTSGSWVDGWALTGDGTDDYTDTGVDLSSLSQFALLFTIERWASMDQNIFGRFDGTESIEIRINTSNQLRWYTFDGSTDHGLSPSAVTIPSGTKTRIVCGFDGSQYLIYKDGSQADSASDSTFTPPSGTNYTHATNNNGSANRYLGGSLDDVIMCDSMPTAQEIQDDYNRQPWS